MSRPPSPGRRQVAARRTVLPPLATLVAAVALALGRATLPPGALAADDPKHALDQPIVDAAWVDRGTSGPPDLLTLSIEDSQLFGSATLTLLRPGDSWAIQSQTKLEFGSDFDGGQPSLMQLSPGRFVVIAATNASTGTLTTVTVDEAAHGAITVERRVDTPIAVAAAGVTDVDGDGTPELVIGGVIGGYNDQCPTQSLAVLDTDERLTERKRVTLRTANDAEIAYVGGASFGQWDDRQGTDLLMQMSECVTDGSSERPHLLGVRLADLTTFRDIATSGADLVEAAPLGNAPVVIDIDRDGRNEAVVAVSSGMEVVDPADGWRITRFADPASTLVAASSRPELGPGTSLIGLRQTFGSETAGVSVTRLTRVDGHVQIGQPSVRQLDSPKGPELDAVIQNLRSAAWSEQSSVLAQDLDGDDCPELVVPLVVVGCVGVGPIEAGPAWTSTRPIGLVGRDGDRRLLVAEGQDWYPGGSSFPSPLAARRLDAWRPFAPSRFVLAEVPVRQASGTGPLIPVRDVPIPAIEHAVSQTGDVDVRRPAGTRLYARIIASGGPVTNTANALAVATKSGFLFANPIDGEWVGATSQLTSLPATSGFGSQPEVQRLALAPNVTNSDGSAAKQWTLTVAALDATGTLSTPVRATALIDIEKPVVKLETPTFSAPWPFTATLRGTSEPGASVTLATGAGTPVVVRADGTFDLPVQLAPWPQDVAVQAVDAAGNESQGKASVMGGADLRGLPWPAIGVVVVLVGVFLSSIRGVRSGSVRQVRPIAVDVNDENATVIEELSAGRIERRD